MEKIENYFPTKCISANMEPRQSSRENFSHRFHSRMTISVFSIEPLCKDLQRLVKRFV